jgi:putative ABC transport system permease protein
VSNLIIASIFVAVVIGFIYWFFGTEFGCSIRATGMNPKMCRAQGINTNTTIIVGLMLSNALIALAGCLISQMQFNTTVNMGTGAIVIGLASIIIGEALTGKKFSFWAKLIMLVVGSMLYRLVITLILMIPGFNTNDLKLLTAIIVAVALAIPAIKNGAQPLMQKLFGKKEKGEELALATAGGEGVINEDDIIVEDNDVKGEEENAEN